MAAPVAFLREQILWIIVALSLGSGLVGAYGRERHEGRRPDSNWWITRLCIMPFLAIVVAFCIDEFALTRQQSALLSALLALMGYEAVRIILERAAQRGASIVDGAIAATAKPYASIVDTDEHGRTTAHVAVFDAANPRRSAIGEGLRGVYREPEDAELPGEMDRLLDELDRSTSDADSDPGADPTLQP